MSNACPVASRWPGGCEWDDDEDGDGDGDGYVDVDVDWDADWDGDGDGDAVACGGVGRDGWVGWGHIE